MRFSPVIMLSRPLWLAALLIAFNVQASPIADLFAKVDPSVVTIRISEQVIDPKKSNAMRSSSGLGTGIVISKDGLIMTANHVVELADAVVVEFSSGELISAKVKSADASTDVALLKLDSLPKKLSVAKLGDSDKVRVGEQIFVIGSPYGVKHTLSVGYVTGRREVGRVRGQLTPVEFLQTDAAINQGNSGGPMFNLKGEVIGIVSHIRTRSGGNEGLGFASTINLAKRMLLDEKSFWAGVEVMVMGPAEAKALNVPQDFGLLVQRVAKNSPAYFLGLRPGTLPIKYGNDSLVLGGDIIIGIMGIQLTDELLDAADSPIRKRVAQLKKGDRIEMTVFREGEVIKLFTTR
ncbi:trypsin-like peptidase domain-containing protein [Aestuariirhabdus sp. Z084]|uniref:S1C family serine protease n=1 Tax=Aestuariirhabdus haliotis TaxID=2918751 RepID=UPI00201B3DF8|nr:trypsin-like peptidase domain-containing protein [Aestuariirhabdus haliotis]MCL6415876.1 trypsin-like peptidase domain-containing protein [Aestuariirhabdus haliotis]MCL6419822.1 trypsin-like peptidase domain-containing protein [Aestuariirhabdus haliotis]